MNSEQSKPLIDFSEAKEPPRTIDQTDQEAKPMESDPQTEDVGERQMIIANIPNGGTLPSEKENLP